MTQSTLVDLPTQPAGPVAQAAALTLAAYAAAGALSTEDYDALLVAHVVSLAGRLDSVITPAYGLAAISRELREIYRELAARRVSAAGAGHDDGLGFMDDDGTPAS